MSDWRVQGVDACKAGWIGIVLSQRALSAYAAARISDRIEDASKSGPLAVIAIDTPIGLPDTGRRQADLLVHNAVGPRWASVFLTPVRQALEADDYASATTLSLKLAGESISRQASALRAKILQVDRWYGRPSTASWRSIPRPASRSSPERPSISGSRPGPA